MIERHTNKDGGARGVADCNLRAHVKLSAQRSQILGHAWERQPIGRGRLGEAVARKVWRDDRKVLGQRRCKRAPGMCRRTGPMREKGYGPLTHHLNMPAVTRGIDKATGLAIRPIRTLDVPGKSRTHRAIAALKQLTLRAGQA